MKRNFKHDVTLSQQMEELQLRMQMLKSDRKVNIDVIEASKAANLEEISRLREGNKEFRQKLTVLQKTARLDEDKGEEKNAEREISRLRKAYDDVRLRSARSHKALDDLKDSAKDLELNSQLPHMEDNELTRCIRVLENKLDKAMIKHNEAQSIRKTYEQTAGQLKEERVGFDNQLSALERTLGAKTRDFKELQLLGGDANHAKDVALGEKERVHQVYDEEKRRREKELKERYQIVQLRRQMLERMQQREKMRNQLARADSDVSDKSPFMSGLGQSQQMVLKIEARNKVDIFETAFRKIREATGVSDVNEVIQKIVSQESSMDNLISLSKENQAKIESLKEVRRTAKIKVEGVKYSGVSGGYRRKIVDDHEDQLADSMTRLDKSKAKFERLTKAILSMKSGVGHLQDMLDPFSEELGTRTVALDDSTVVEVLRECELCLVRLNKRLEVSEESRSKSRLNGKLERTYGTSPISGQIKSGTSSDINIGVTESPDKSGNIIVHQITTNTSPVVRPYNQRIELNIGDEDDSNAKEQSPTSKPDSDLDEEEFTREKVKRASSQILAQVTRKKGKPKK